MVQWFARVTTAMLAIIILFVLGAVWWGKQFNEIPALTIQSLASDDRLFTFFDIETQISYQAQTSTFYSTSPNGRWQIRDEWVDGQFHIYIKSAYALNFRLLGRYDVPNNSSIAWASDSQSLLVVYKPYREDLTIEQIDIETGEATLFGTYEFAGQVIYANMIDENQLIVWGINNSLIVNMDTNDTYLIESGFVYTRLSADARYLVHGSLVQYGDIDLEESILHILDLETLETVTFTADDFGGGILNIMQWSPTGAILPIADINNNIILYDAETQTQRRLDLEYLMYSSFSGWASDGTHIFAVRRLNAEEIAYVALNIETGDSVQLLTASDREPSTQRLYYYYPQTLQWSPDNDYILSTPSQSYARLVYDIYDAETGDLLYSVDERTGDRREIYVGWWWN